jgi:8-oxo-dGTP diphosphatase
VLQPSVCASNGSTHMWFSGLHLPFLAEGQPIGGKMQEVRVGTALIIVRDGKVLVGERLGSHATGLIGFPGGHLEFGETWEQGVLREVLEECGPKFKVRIKPFYSPLKLELCVTNDIMKKYDKHYITIFMMADWISGEAENTEPQKCSGWKWINFDQLKEYHKIGRCADWIPLEQIETYRSHIGI